MTPPAASPSPKGWIWGQGNDVHEQLVPGADGVPGTVLHIGKIVKDPFFDAGLAAQGARLQLGTDIRRWNEGTDEEVDLQVPGSLDREDGCGELRSGVNSNTRSPMPGGTSPDRGMDAC